MKNNSQKTEKKEFIAPKLTVLGDIEVITLSNVNGSRLDATFPVGTPEEQLTFS